MQCPLRSEFAGCSTHRHAASTHGFIPPARALLSSVEVRSWRAWWAAQESNLRRFSLVSLSRRFRSPFRPCSRGYFLLPSAGGYTLTLMAKSRCRAKLRDSTEAGPELHRPGAGFGFVPRRVCAARVSPPQCEDHGLRFFSRRAPLGPRRRRPLTQGGQGRVEARPRSSCALLPGNNPRRKKGKNRRGPCRRPGPPTGAAALLTGCASVRRERRR